MNGTKTFIVECARINSIRVKSEGDDANNKSSWINRTKDFMLKKGDSVSLQNVIINIRGANSNSIEFTGGEISPTNPLQDNFTELEVGFYLGNNGTNSQILPVSYTKGSGSKSKLNTDTEKFSGAGADQLINNNLGQFTDTQYFSTTTTDSDKIGNVYEIYGMNPNLNIDGSKFCKIDIRYKGFARDPTTGKRKTDDYPKASLMTQKIPLIISQGFIDPNSVADSLSIQLQNTEPITTSSDLKIPEGNYFTQGSGGLDYRIPMSQYRTNGFTMKTIPANLQSVNYQGVATHKIYGNLATDEPFVWLYGSHILSDIETFNGQELGGGGFDPLMAKSDVDNRDNFKYNYPIFLWSIFNGNDPTNINDYNLYSPYKTTIGGDGNDDVLEISGFSSTNNMDNYNDFYVGAIPQATTTGLNIIRNENNLYFTQQFRLEAPNPLINPQVYLDNDDPSYTNFVVYNRINQYNGTWIGTGHNIVRVVSYSDFDTTYQFGGVGDGTDLEYFKRNSDVEADYLTRSFKTQDQIGGVAHERLMFNFLDRSIVNGTEYKLTFKTTGTSASYKRAIGVKDIVACGFQPSTAGLDSITTNGTHTYSFTATSDYAVNDILTFAYTNIVGEDGFSILVENISFQILHSEVGINYTITDIFNESTDKKKFYKYQKDSSESDLQITLTGNSTAEFNLVYKFIARGLVGQLIGSEWFSSNSLGGNDSNTTMFYNNDSASNTYWLIKQPTSTIEWYVVKTTKYNSDTITSGTKMGDNVSSTIVKNQYRSGTQFYDLGGVYNSTIVSNTQYNLASGNTWLVYPPPSVGVETYDFTDTNGTRPNGFQYNHIYQRQLPSVGNLVYLATTASDGKSGTAQYDTGGSAIWSGTWTLTTSGGTQGYGELTLTASWGSEIFNVANTLTSTNTFTQGTITSRIGQGDTITFGFYTKDIAYILSFDSNTIRLEVGDHEGTSGFFYVDPAPYSNNGTWTLNPTTGVLQLTQTAGGSSFDETYTFTGSTPIPTTDIVLYPDLQFSGFGNIYVSPRNGTNFPTTTFGGYGDTQQSVASNTEYFLGRDSMDDVDIHDGDVYNSISDTTKRGTWNFDTSHGTADYRIIIKDLAGTEVDTLSRNNSTDPILSYGNILVKGNKTASSSIANDLQVPIQEIYYITQSRNENTELKGKSGVSDGNYTINGQTGTFNNKYNQDANISTANLVKHQLILTNIQYTEANVKIIENYFRGTEVYNGDKVVRQDILEDTENYYVEVDIGRSDDSDVSSTETITDGILQNTSNKTPLVSGYMRDTGQIGKDNGAGDDENVGCTFPRNFTNKGVEQKLKLFTRFKDEFRTRLIAKNQILIMGTETENAIKCYARYTLDNFENVDGYAYAKENNIGVYPYFSTIGPNIDGSKNFVMGFELYDDYTDEEIYKIQNGTYFGFSPSMFDHNYITPMNGDQCAINVDVSIPNVITSDDNPIGDFRATDLINDYMNYINIGSDNPTISFSNSLTKFQVSYFHTPVKFSLDTGTTSNLGEEIARLLDDKIIFRQRTAPINNGYQRKQIAEQNNSTPLSTPNPPPYINLNVGINDTQAGIYIFSIKGRTNNDDNTLTDIKPSTYDGTLFYKLGFSYYDLLPQSFSQQPFRNRFNDLNYNNTELIYRQKSIRPFTTNSNINVGDTTSMNMQTIVNRYASGSPSDDPATPSTTNVPNPNKDTPSYRLGYNNNISVSLETESDFLNAKSIPVNISSAFYRVMTDLPVDTLEYNAGGSSLSCIGYALKNYSSSSFFFSYGMDFGATITRDTLISNIRTELRNDRGQLIKGIDGRSSVIYKIIRTIQLSEPEPDPEVEELKDIEEQLKKLNEKQDEENLSEKLQNNILEDIQEGNPQGEPVLTAETENFMDAFEKAIIMRVVNEVQIPIQMLRRSRGRGGGDPSRNVRTTRNLNKIVIKNMARAISSFYIKNRYKLTALRKALSTPKGRQELREDPKILTAIRRLKDFNINADGEVVYGADDDPDSATREVGRFSLSRAGAEYIVDEINKKIDSRMRDPNTGIMSGERITEGSLATFLSPLISEMFKQNEIRANYGDGIKSKLEKEVIDEEILRDPLPEAIKDELGVKAVEKFNERPKQARSIEDIYAQMKKAIREDDNTTANILRRVLISRLRDMGIRLPSETFLKKIGRGRGLTPSEKQSRKDIRKEGKSNIQQIREAEAKLGERVEVQARDPQASLFSDFLSIPLGGAGKDDDMSTSREEINRRNREEQRREKRGGGQ